MTYDKHRQSFSTLVYEFRDNNVIVNDPLNSLVVTLQNENQLYPAASMQFSDVCDTVCVYIYTDILYMLRYINSPEHELIKGT